MKWWRDIFIGLVMGDACVELGGNGHLALSMANREFLEYLDQKISPYSNGVHVHMTPIQANSRRSDDEIQTRKTIYRLRTVNHEIFKEMRSNWYPNGEKRFPDDLSINPTIAKYWFVCDGTIRKIKSINEGNRPDFLISLFKDTPISPVWKEKKSNIYFKGDEWYRFLDWIGDPLPGFEYKWDWNEDYNNPKVLAEYRFKHGMSYEDMALRLSCGEGTAWKKTQDFSELVMKHKEEQGW